MQSTNPAHSTSTDEEREVTDSDFARIVLYGTLVGVPAMWAVSFVFLLPFGVQVAAVTAVAVAVAAGPFAGGLFFLVRRLFQLHRLPHPVAASETVASPPEDPRTRPVEGAGATAGQHITAA
jgi:hypothetical protein